MIVPKRMDLQVQFMRFLLKPISYLVLVLLQVLLQLFLIFHHIIKIFWNFLYLLFVGYVSHRKPTDGTWYIQALCSVLDMHAATIDLLAMLTKTTNKVTKLESKYEDRNIPCGKQVPETHSRLSRLVYFKQKKNVNQWLEN